MLETVRIVAPVRRRERCGVWLSWPWMLGSSIPEGRVEMLSNLGDGCFVRDVMPAVDFGVGAPAGMGWFESCRQSGVRVQRRWRRVSSRV